MIRDSWTMLLFASTSFGNVNAIFNSSSNVFPLSSLSLPLTYRPLDRPKRRDNPTENPAIRREENHTRVPNVDVIRFAEHF